jgi:hypothetical protein
LKSKLKNQTDTAQKNEILEIGNYILKKEIDTYGFGRVGEIGEEEEETRRRRPLEGETVRALLLFV